jgi:hypothetical protein
MVDQMASHRAFHSIAHAASSTVGHALAAAGSTCVMQVTCPFKAKILVHGTECSCCDVLLAMCVPNWLQDLGQQISLADMPHQLANTA